MEMYARASMRWPTFPDITIPPASGRGGRKQAKKSLDLAAVNPLGIAVRNQAGLFGRKLREPAAVVAHGVAVARPAAVDPGVGAEQEAVGMLGKQVAPFGREAPAAFGDATAV